MADQFFEQYGTQPLRCSHEHNDGISCHDCCALLTQFSQPSFQETQNYIPRRLGGNIIKESDLNRLSIPPPVLTKANELFGIITAKKIFRGMTRLGVIAGCLLHAYKALGVFVSGQDIIRGLNITTSKCLFGLQKVDLFLWENARDKYHELTRHNISFEQATCDLAQRIGLANVATIDFSPHIKHIHTHCRITTAAAVAVWLHIDTHNLQIPIELVAQMAALSVNTLRKVCLTRIH